MDIVITFKSYLLNQKTPPSAITVKNYLSDVRKFINWYEKTYQRPFNPINLSSAVVSQYQTAIQASNQTHSPSTSSAKRYLSSLRRFAAFLEDSGAISINPFSTIEKPQTNPDPLFIEEFKRFLYTEQASNLTIKNYIVDIKQFLGWLTQVTNLDAEKDASTLLTKIDNYTLEQYKERLYNQAKLSPLSINRKLSSLRRYIRWLGDKGILLISVNEPSYENKEEPQPEEQPITEPVRQELPLTALQGLAEEETNDNKTTYSSFAPIRLIQKTTKIITLGGDLLLLNPIVKSAEAIQYSLWKKGKKTIFAPVTSILETSSYIPKSVSVKTIIPKETSIQAPRSANPASILKKTTEYGTTNPDTIHNFAKALYAPLQLSTKQMTWKQRVWHHLRHTRPEWYRAYHTLGVTNYIHYAILIIAAVIAGSSIYQTWLVPTGKKTQAVLSAQATAPPRTLSFQGRLLDKTNTPITAETPLRFALYNSPTATGSALLWTEKQDITPDHNGYFNTTLGEKSHLYQNIFTDNPNLYLGVSIGNHQELTPRQRIPTINYAADSKTIEGLKPITDTPNLAQNVLLALDSAGNLTIGGAESHTFQATGGQLSVSGQTLLLTTNPGSNGNIKIAPNGSGIIDLEKPIQNTSNYSSPGGIPGAVEVKDMLSILAASSSHSALTVNQNGIGDIISGQSNGTDKFSLDNEGNAFFAGNISTNGDTIDISSTSFDIGGSAVKNLTIGSNAYTISLGGSSGITAINNSLSVSGVSALNGPVNASGLLSANAGLYIPHDQKITIASFSAGAIPYIDSNSQIAQDQNHFTWDNNNEALNIKGTICLYTNTVCDSTHKTAGILYANNESTWYGDLAENYISSQKLEPGDVVALEGQDNNDAVIKATAPYQQQLLGIVSTNPGITLNSGAKTDPQHPYIYPLALQGRVPVNVSSINGPIQAGDDLTSSAIPGVAMKATASGQIIGKALESYNNPYPNAVGQIMAFVNLSYRTNPATITDSGNLAAATESGMLQNSQPETTSSNGILQTLNDTVSVINLGFAKAQTITTQSLHVTTDNIMIGGQTLKDYITTIVTKLVDQEINKRLTQMPQNPQIITPISSSSASTMNQTISPTVTPTPNASTSAPLQIAGTDTATQSATIYNSIGDNTKISPSEISIATSSATTASDAAGILPSASESGTIQNVNQSPTPTIQQFNSGTNSNHYTSIASYSGQLSYVPNLKSDYATFNQGLIALGPTSLTDVAVSNTLTINNNLRITADTIDTIGTDLNIEPLRQGNIRFMGGLVAIDTQGNLQVGGNANFEHNVTVHGKFAAGIIAPIPNKDLTINLPNKKDQSGSSMIITNAKGNGVLKINQSGDVDSSGEANFNTIASHGFTIIRGAEADTSMTKTIANSSAGKGIITAYETQRTIVTPYVTAHSLIYITAASNTEQETPYLARQTVANPAYGTPGSFTVEIPTPITQNIKFNWVIVN